MGRHSGGRTPSPSTKSYLKDLGIEGIGSTAQIALGASVCGRLTDGIRSFTQSPYVFTTLQRARNLLNLDGEKGDKSTFFWFSCSRVPTWRRFAPHCRTAGGHGRSHEGGVP